eukprot:gene6911-9463_t
MITASSPPIVQVSDMYMIIIKYVKDELISSIELQLDKKLKVLDQVIFENIQTRFTYNNDKSKYHVTYDTNQLLIMDILKGMTYYGWKLLTSNAFLVNPQLKTVETYFYYEKFTGSPSNYNPILNTSNSSQNIASQRTSASVSPLFFTPSESSIHSTTALNNLSTLANLTNNQSNPIHPNNKSLNPSFAARLHNNEEIIDSSNSERLSGSSEVPPSTGSISTTSILLADAAQAGPYSFVQRKSLLTVNGAKLRKSDYGIKPNNIPSAPVGVGMSKPPTNPVANTTDQEARPRKSILNIYHPLGNNSTNNNSNPNYIVPRRSFDGAPNNNITSKVEETINNINTRRPSNPEVSTFKLTPRESFPVIPKSQTRQGTNNDSQLSSLASAPPITSQTHSQSKRLDETSIEMNEFRDKNLQPRATAASNHEENEENTSNNVYSNNHLVSVPHKPIDNKQHPIEKAYMKYQPERSEIKDESSEFLSNETKPTNNEHDHNSNISSSHTSSESKSVETPPPSYPTHVHHPTAIAGNDVEEQHVTAKKNQELLYNQNHENNHAFYETKDHTKVAVNADVMNEFDAQIRPSVISDDPSDTVSSPSPTSRSLDRISSNKIVNDFVSANENNNENVFDERSSTAQLSKAASLETGDTRIAPLNNPLAKTVQKSNISAAMMQMAMPPTTKQSRLPEDDPERIEAEAHESNKLTHYSKLGSAFLSDKGMSALSSVRGRGGAGRGGGGRGRGLN